MTNICDTDVNTREYQPTYENDQITEELVKLKAKHIYYNLECSLKQISSSSIGMLNVRSLLQKIEKLKRFDYY